MTARYGQLSYTSFDASGSAGGWRVKQTGGDLDEAEEALLVAGVHTVLNPVKPLPAFPTAAQLQRIPHRLAYRRINRNTACYWHTVPAEATTPAGPATCSCTRCWIGKLAKRRARIGLSSCGVRNAGFVPMVVRPWLGQSCPQNHRGRATP
ncbi:hypothetical protein I547_6371 [Mycobacterium kansasii 824]|nr:hypothetical protein I547_6371 [Mycobacterium kansasii 824]